MTHFFGFPSSERADAKHVLDRRYRIRRFDVRSAVIQTRAHPLRLAYFLPSKSGRYRSSPSSFSFSTGTNRSDAELIQKRW